MMDSVELEALRIRYRQMTGGAVMSLFGGAAMAVSGASLIEAPPAIEWFVIHAFVLFIRTWRARRVLEVGITTDNMRWLQRALFFQTAVSAIIWGATAFIFIDFEQPVSVVITIGLLTGVAAHSSSNESSAPWPFVLWIAITCSIVAARFLLAPDISYVSFAFAIAVYGVVLLSTCLRQARVLRETLTLRFENRDMVERLGAQKAEAEHARHIAESASLAKSQFLAAASHDLRQPLYALSLFSTSLGGLKLDIESRKVVEKIQESVASMESLFVGLLDVSRLDAGVVQSRPEPVSIDALFDRLSQYFHPVAVERGLDLRFRSDAEWVVSDATLLEQVMSNLVSNALRCTNRGAVLIAARKRGDRVRLEVWDTGIGISETDRQRIFDEFVQLNNPERDRRMGLGLGLSIAQRSAALIGGTIELVSKVGRGSRFSLVQPATAAPTAGSPRLSSTPSEEFILSPTQNLPVLIVDDDRDLRAALSELLSRSNLQFDLAANADEALALIETGRQYRVILTDYRLPGVTNGLELIAAINRRWPNALARFALITGDLNSELISEAHAQGVPLFHKPLRPEKLLSLLHSSESAAF